MKDLEKMFPSLTLFSDINWEDVSEEYKSEYGDISFPEYLQQKASEGDCPDYLYELAFFELAQSEIENGYDLWPKDKGVHLNPSALFLNLEFDVVKMLERAAEGEIEIHERPHFLCLYVSEDQDVEMFELDEAELEVLEHLEEGPQPDKSFVTEGMKQKFDELVRKKLIFDLT